MTLASIFLPAVSGILFLSPWRPSVNHSFSELAEKYLLWAARQRSYRSKQVIVRQLIGEFGNIPLRRFSTLLVEEYQSKILARGNKPATSNRHLAAMKHMFTKAVEWDFVEDEILKRVRRIKLLQENNWRLRFLSKDECMVLVNACNPHLRQIVVITQHGLQEGRESLLAVESAH